MTYSPDPPELVLSSCEMEMVEALNGVSEPTATSLRIAELRRTLWRARLQCQDAGRTVNSAAAFAWRIQSDSEAYVRRCAKSLAIAPDLLPRGYRQWMALATAAVAATAIYAALSILPGVAAVLAACAAALTFTAVDTALADMLPTAGVRMGRISANLECGLVEDIFPIDSRQFRDYRATYRRHLLRVHRRLGPAPWVGEA